MQMRARSIALFGATAAALLASSGQQSTAAVLSSFNSPVVEDFNSLASTGTTSSTLPASGWIFAESGTNANATYTVGTGSSNSGDTYSFGATSATDRALGGLRSGSLISTIGAPYQNSTGSTITELNISYIGEQWRLGATGRNDRLDFEYSTDAVSLTTGTWIPFDALDFIAPISTGTVGPLDGNAAANSASVSASISGLNLASGSTIWVRFTDFDATSSDDGLAVDNFSVTAVPEPATACIALGACGLLIARQRGRRS